MEQTIDDALTMEQEAVFYCEKDSRYNLNPQNVSNSSQFSQNTAIFYADGEYITSFAVAGANGMTTENAKIILLTAGEKRITVKYPDGALTIAKISIYEEK